MTDISTLPYSPASLTLVEAVDREIIIIDGAMGTMIQQAALSEDDFRGSRFASHSRRIAGCNDVLSVTRPDLIASIHTAYLEAGARIIETNSFNSNSISLADYALEPYVAEIAGAAARVAREAADAFMASRPGAPQVWVAGSIGPSGKSLTMEGAQTFLPDLWDALADTYSTQAEALIRGGVDLIMIETVFDTLNAKAAIWACRRAMERCGRRVPLIISATLTESGRTLSGQTVGALAASVAHAEPLAIGLNCGFGAADMEAHLRSMQTLPFRLSAYPNAGLPNALGEYDETPQSMAAKMRPLLRDGLLNLAGGCCGTTPAHIAAIAAEARGLSPRKVPPRQPLAMTLSGLEALSVAPDDPLVKIGERCNVAGSRKFLRLIREGAIDEALSIASAQTAAGAAIIDVNMDDALLDARREMALFLGRLATEPEAARVPVMIDSSDWSVIEAALKCVQGRPVVNSISIKEGEEAFLARAAHIREMGAAVVVMAFDEEGQAVTYERRTAICARAYRLLTEKAGFHGCDVVLDPNILTVATGIADHDSYALDFLRATQWIKTNLPGAKVSGGVSNLSFAFRGNNPLREMMHALFLRHATQRGMDMAIVNPSTAVMADTVDGPIRKAIDDVLLDSDPGATARLVEAAAAMQPPVPKAAATTTGHDAVPADPAAALAQALVDGRTDSLDGLLEKALAAAGSAAALIDGPLMEGMNRVGTLFGQGRMFLPQVVKSAQTMRRAVTWLTPVIEAERRESADGGSRRSRMVLATVKGDVHDIGKQIVSVVVGCNGFDVTDLGVMVPADTIIDTAVAEDAEFIGLSGLITPSLEEMCAVARAMERRGLTIPLFVGGAATSDVHTAVRIAPCYSGPVVHTRDAAAMPGMMRLFADPATRPDATETLRARQEELRRSWNEGRQTRLQLSDARSRRLRPAYAPVPPADPGIHTIAIPVADVERLINWRAFAAAWGLEASMGEIGAVRGCGHCQAQWLAAVPTEKMPQATRAMQLVKDARLALDWISRQPAEKGIMARVAILPARSTDDDCIETTLPDGSRLTIPMLRSQTEAERCPSLADYVSADGADHVALFAVTAGSGVAEIASRLNDDNEEYRSLIYQTVAHRLAEAATEWLHRHVASTLWGYAPGAMTDGAPGIRPAVGYPSMPDQSEVFLLDRALDYRSLGITLTETGALSPSATTTGLILAHPEGRYFSVGTVADDQIADYARRRGMTPADVARFLPR